GLALEPDHDEEKRAIVEGAEVEDLDDVGVAERADYARFAQEALDVGALQAPVGVEDLDRHLLVEPHVHRGVDRAHRAAPDEPMDPVLAVDEAIAEAARQRRRGEGRWPCARWRRDRLEPLRTLRGL